MKKYLGLSFVLLFCLVLFGSCNDNGASEPRDGRYLIQNHQPLKKQYAAVGLLAWVAAFGVWKAGNKAVSKQKPDRWKY